MLKFIRRSNDFLLEQDDSPVSDSPSGEGAQYTAPKDRLLSTPSVDDTLTDRDASVDEKIDKYLMQYEKESVPIEGSESPDNDPVITQNSKNISERKKFTLKSLLFEQDAPPADLPDSEPDASPSSMGADLGNSDETGSDQKVNPEPVPVPKINIRKFAEGIARLANNYQSLIDPKRIILNRAQAYITKNYSVRLAKELMSILERDFDLTPKTNNQKEMESPSAPYAGNAGPESGGAGSGASSSSS